MEDNETSIFLLNLVRISQHAVAGVQIKQYFSSTEIYAASEPVWIMQKIRINNKFDSRKTLVRCL